MQNPEKLSIKEAAAVLGIAPSKLRYWEQEGLISSKRDNTNNYRTFELHELIEASDILFYRNLGVPLETLKGYRELSIKELEKSLEEIQASVERKIIEMQETRSRILAERKALKIGSALLDGELKEGKPDLNKFDLIDYSSREQLEYLMQNPQAFGILIQADSPTTIHETCLDYPDTTPFSTFWHIDEASFYTYLECVVAIDTETQTTDISPLLDQARRLNYVPHRILGKFFATATDTTRQDYYRAWIECE